MRGTAIEWYYKQAQGEPPEAAIRGILQKTYSQKFRKIYRKIPVPESLFNKVAGLHIRVTASEPLNKHFVHFSFCKIILIPLGLYFLFEVHKTFTTIINSITHTLFPTKQNMFEVKKLQARRPVTLLKETEHGVFLWLLRNFYSFFI